MSKVDIFIDTNLCKGCGICVYVCPKGVFKLSSEFSSRGYHYAIAEHPEKCVKCELCMYSCPDFAICIVTKG